MQLTIKPETKAASALDNIIDYAIIHGASDVHIDPESGNLAVRMRIDGVLTHCVTISLSLHQELIARIKVLARLRPDIHLLAQDGRFSYTEKSFGVTVDMRVSIIPTHFGENAVIRILAGGQRTTILSSLGFSPDNEAIIRETLTRNQGMILVTGPTGSGKTSTMYAMLRELVCEPLSIVTLEDPYRIRHPRHPSNCCRPSLRHQFFKWLAFSRSSGPGCHYGRRDPRQGNRSNRYEYRPDRSPSHFNSPYRSMLSAL